MPWFEVGLAVEQIAFEVTSIAGDTAAVEGTVVEETSAADLTVGTELVAGTGIAETA